MALYLSPVPLVVLSAGLFGWLAWHFQGGVLRDVLVEQSVENGATVYSMDPLAIGLPFVTALVVTAVGHELLHGLALRQFGYEVDYGVAPKAGAVYTVALGQFLTREHLLWVSVAPLLGLTLVCVPLLAVPVPEVALTALFVLVLNTGGSGPDLYLAVRALRWPPGTVVYDTDLEHSYVYHPRE